MSLLCKDVRRSPDTSILLCSRYTQSPSALHSGPATCCTRLATAWVSNSPKPAATCHRLHCWRDCLPTTLRGTLCQVCRGSELDKFQSNSNSHCHITLRVPTRAVQMELVVSRAAAVQLVPSSQKQKGQTPAAFSGRGSYGIKRRNRHIKP